MQMKNIAPVRKASTNYPWQVFSMLISTAGILQLTTAFELLRKCTKVISFPKSNILTCKQTCQNK